MLPPMDEGDQARAGDERPAGADAAEGGPSGRAGDERPAGADAAEGGPSGRAGDERPAGADAAEGGPSGRPRRHTLRDVAAAAGVSIGTASNAFNRPELISEG